MQELQLGGCSDFGPNRQIPVQTWMGSIKSAPSKQGDRLDGCVNYAQHTWTAVIASLQTLGLHGDGTVISPVDTVIEPPTSPG